MLVFLFSAVLLLSYYSGLLFPSYSEIGRLSPFFLFALLTTGYAIASRHRFLSIPKSTSAPFLLLVVALTGAFLSHALRISTTGLELPELAVFFLTSWMLLIITPWPTRRLVDTLLMCCLIAATIDAVANTLAVLDLIDLQVYGGRHTDFGSVTRYPGLSGSTHFAGLVAFLACSSLLFRLKNKPQKRPMAQATVTILLLILIILSLVLIDARRYLLALILVAAMAYLPWVSRIPLFIVGAGVAASVLAYVFAIEAFGLADSSDLRARLILDAAREANSHWLLGVGAEFVDNAALEATYESLSSGGVSESLFLSMATYYGVLSSTCLVAGALWTATIARRAAPKEAIILTALTAELFYGGSLNGLLGSLVYFACFWVCIRKIGEVPRPHERGVSKLVGRPLPRHSPFEGCARTSWRRASRMGERPNGR